MKALGKVAYESYINGFSDLHPGEVAPDFDGLHPDVQHSWDVAAAGVIEEHDLQKEEDGNPPGAVTLLIGAVSGAIMTAILFYVGIQIARLTH